MIVELLKLLSTQELQLPELGKRLNLSVINTLSTIAKVNQYEPNLISSTGGRLTLSRKINWLDSVAIKELLLAQQLTYDVIILNELLSTNTYCLTTINNYNKPTIVSSELQTAGRGRFGRVWQSKLASDITVSLVYQFPIKFNLPIIPILIAVAVNRLFKNYRIPNQIKWPNDIYSDGKKICGILVENILRNQQNNLVIGIGINNIGNWDRNCLVADLALAIDNLLKEYQLFGFQLLRREWLDNCLHYQKQVSLRNDKETIAHGIHHDLGEEGELVIKTSNEVTKYSNSFLSLDILN